MTLGQLVLFRRRVPEGLRGAVGGPLLSALALASALLLLGAEGAVAHCPPNCGPPPKAPPPSAVRPPYRSNLPPTRPPDVSTIRGPKTPPSAVTAGAATEPLDFGELEDAIRDGANQNAGRDSVWSRVFGNLLNRQWPDSCVEASEARAGDVAAEIRNRIKSGQIKLNGHSIKVGTRSGYQTWGASWHTYTVIEVKDPGGKSVRTIEVDTYVVPRADVDTPDDLIGPPTPVLWNDATQQATPLHTIE